MKTLIAALFAITLGTTMVLAQDVNVSGCTADKHGVTSTMTLDDADVKSHPEAPAHVQRAFSNAASGLSAQDFLYNGGFQAFLNGLDDDDYDAIENITTPVVSDTCVQ